jgi:putative restriction endonuclease
MKLKKSQDLYSLAHGDVVTKRNLYDLIQYSKVEASPYWSGPESIIGNTPQQGINWVGHTPELQAVIIKTRAGAYKADGWLDIEKTLYRYSFKAKSGEISYGEMANEVLIKQPQHLYPILLFAEHKDGWRFEGAFSVVEIESEFVVLHRGAPPSEMQAPQDELVYHEGTRKYVTHLMAERNKGVVKALKSVNQWVCDICSEDFLSRYGVKYIEAHHKIPTSTYSSRYVVRLSDLALLCPNCHRAVHIYMKSTGLDYTEIKNKMRAISQDSTL